MTTTSQALTRGIRVTVVARYSKEHSDPPRRWVFLYTISIVNEGSETVTLDSRRWTITDANGHVEEVRGPGVVGKQPVLAPGESFEYTSGCPLDTPFGSMHGSYLMRSEGGVEFDVEVAGFALRQPGTMQ
jgi:ApaG protein